MLDLGEGRGEGGGRWGISIRMGRGCMMAWRPLPVVQGGIDFCRVWRSGE